MKNLSKTLTIAATFFMLTAFAVSARAQWKNAGQLNVWTMSQVMRVNDKLLKGGFLAEEKSSFMREIRTAKQDGFERVVLEFEDHMPSFQILYVTHKHTDRETEKVIKQQGKYFVDVVLGYLPFHDVKVKLEKYPTGALNYPLLAEISQVQWFEGERVFSIGLNAKKNFRVQTLSNPTRLVIDFQN